MKVVNKGDYEVEYHPKLAILRISILLVMIFLLGFGIFAIIGDDEPDREELAEEVILKEIYNETKLVEQNSRGGFFSLDEKVFVEGESRVTVREDGSKSVKFVKFKVTNNPNLKLILSTDIYGKNRIDVVQRLLGNVGDQEYNLPDGIDLETHKYLLFWDKKSNRPLAYTVLV